MMCASTKASSVMEWERRPVHQGMPKYAATIARPPTRHQIAHRTTSQVFGVLLVAFSDIGSFSWRIARGFGTKQGVRRCGRAPAVSLAALLSVAGKHPAVVESILS